MPSKITDIIVNITTKHPAIVVGSGVPAIFVKGDVINNQSYTELDALEADYANATDVYKAAKAYYDQKDYAGKTVEVITYTESVTDPDTKAVTGGISAAAEAYFWGAWHFAVMATYNAADALELSNYVEAQSEKFVVVQQTEVADLAPFANNTRTILLWHKTAGERMDLALLGRVANLDVGSATWKSKGGLVGISPDEQTYAEYKTAETAHVISYVVKGKEPVTSDGFTASGDWIDQLHGIDWVKENIESTLQEYLNTQDKVPFNDAGFAMLEQQVRSVLQAAYDQEIIAYDAVSKGGKFEVTSEKYDDVPAEDIKNREYNGINWWYTPADAVQGMTVGGQVNYAA